MSPKRTSLPLLPALGIEQYGAAGISLNIRARGIVECHNGPYSFLRPITRQQCSGRH